MEFKVAGQYHFETTECCACGVVFAMPKELMEHFRKTRNSFTCPSGHGQYFSGKTETEKLREKIKDYEQQLQNKQHELTIAQGMLKQRKKRRTPV